MLHSLKESLNGLNLAFNTNTSAVIAATKKLESELNTIKTTTDKISNTENLTSVVNLIENLSIQNDYKLSILKEFPTYLLNKK
tara:strand:+ start:106 stop:354 length:249 start_codon:yes stop_codon:yes gene_type:complete